MPVIDVRKDPENLSLTLTARFDAPVERVWQVWADPRQLERWWGPPSHPATVVEHDLAPGASVSYFMTGPEGDKYHGWWRIRAVEAPHRLEFEDGFSDDAGRPNLELPTTGIEVVLAAEGEGTTVMTVRSVFPSAEAMAQLDSMGMVEGMTQAMNQVDGLFSEAARPA
jgi:uncharacterized protein YndB with AHSA1/START domain